MRNKINPPAQDGKNLSFIDPDFLKQFPEATHLHFFIADNELSHIDPNFLQYTSFVERLDGFLSNNNLTHINPDFLQYTPFVTYLDGFLRGNKLTEIDPDFLQYTPNVTELFEFLSHNNLDQRSVDGILVKLDSYGKCVGNFGIDGGNNAAPSNGHESGYNGIKAVANLRDRGWIVDVN